MLVLLVCNEANAFIRMLREYNRLYASDEEEQYRSLFLDPVCTTLENVVFEEDLVEECVENGIADLFCDMLKVPYLASSAATQQLIVFIAVLRQFYPRFCNASVGVLCVATDEKEHISQAISGMIDSVKDATCKRRLSRMIQ